MKYLICILIVQSTIIFSNLIVVIFYNMIKHMESIQRTSIMRHSKCLKQNEVCLKCLWIILGVEISFLVITEFWTGLNYGFVIDAKDVFRCIKLWIFMNSNNSKVWITLQPSKVSHKWVMGLILHLLNPEKELLQPTTDEKTYSSIQLICK